MPKSAHARLKAELAEATAAYNHLNAQLREVTNSTRGSRDPLVQLGLELLRGKVGAAEIRYSRAFKALSRAEAPYDNAFATFVTPKTRSNHTPIDVGAHTETGPVRERNEDNIYVDPALGFAIVCDGMGGHNGGELASTLAMETVAGALLASRNDGHPAHRLEDAAQQAQAAVLEAGRSSPQLRGMGTTLVAALIDEGKAYIVSVGDSRAYLVKDAKKATLLTSDETHAGVLFSKGLISWEQFTKHPQRNKLLRAIGSPWKITAELDYAIQLRVVPVRVGDRLVLCTDGVSESLMPNDIAALAQGPLREAVRKMVKVALSRDGGDNATVAILEVR